MCRSTGRVPMAQPPGSDTRASPQRAKQRPQHQDRGAHLAHEVVGRRGRDDTPGVELQHVAVLVWRFARRPW